MWFPPRMHTFPVNLFQLSERVWPSGIEPSGQIYGERRDQKNRTTHSNGNTNSEKLWPTWLKTNTSLCGMWILQFMSRTFPINSGGNEIWGKQPQLRLRHSIRDLWHLYWEKKLELFYTLFSPIFGHFNHTEGKRNDWNICFRFGQSKQMIGTIAIVEYWWCY